MEQSLKPNGLKVKSYGDVAAIVGILAPTLVMLFSTVAWGLKLEGELNEVRNDVVALQRQVGAGVLPRAAERLTYVERQVNEHVARDIERWRTHDQEFPPRWLVDRVSELERRLNERNNP